MDGYDEATYGDRFVDVYDDWYGSVTDTDTCVQTLARLAGTQGAVLELGVGTGRLAIPLTRLDISVTGIDASAAMLEQLAAKPGGEAVTAVLGDMAAPDLAGQSFSVVVVAYNTLFNLVSSADQERCVINAAALLDDHGCFVVEAFVPDPSLTHRDTVAPKQITADRVVLSVTCSGADPQEVMGQYVDISEAGIKLRPWHIRWSTPSQIDAMAARAGLTLHERWENWAGDEFHHRSDAHVSIYRRSDQMPKPN